jgi:chromosome segregation ATPase
MRGRTGISAGAIALALLIAGGASGADSDTKASREREMLRRAQEALRQSQTDNEQLAHAKQESEQKLKDAAAQLDAARNASKSSQASLKGQLQGAAAAREELNHKLEDANRQIAALAAKQQQMLGQLNARDEDLKQVRRQLDASTAANVSCEAKNLKLYEYSQELVQRYAKKGVWAALAQKEPVTGIKEVGVENLVQEYQEKLDKEKLAPAAPAAGSSSH